MQVFHFPIRVAMSVLVLLGLVVTLFSGRTPAEAAAPVNGDCTLLVPAAPLSAQGLSTPYQLVATNPANGPCHEANPMQAAFVQGAVLNPATGALAIYNPLVVDQGTTPAAPPIVPTLPQAAVVALWFGFNGINLTLQDSNGSLQQGQCVNGSAGTLFGQFAYCHARAFFQAARPLLSAGMLVPPPLGVGLDQQPCPTTRDFSIVDQDQSDNVTTTYLVTPLGQTAQDTQANAATLGGQVQKNGSDERLLTLVDAALGCTPWMVPDLADPGQSVSALPLNELQAAAEQSSPVALVPNADPMVLVNQHPDLAKLNAYRAGVDQPISPNAQASGTRTYCQHLLAMAPTRLQADAPFTQGQPSPDAAMANSLLTFLAQRFVTTYGANGLNCQARLKQPDPVTVQTNAQGVATRAEVNGVPLGGGTPVSSPTASVTPVAATLSTPGMQTAWDCQVKGTMVPGCRGTATLHGQTGTFASGSATSHHGVCNGHTNRVKREVQG